MSSSVIGEPLAMTATCARATAGANKAAAMAAAASHFQIDRGLTFFPGIATSIASGVLVSGFLRPLPHPSQPAHTANRLADRRAAERAQAQLQHDLVVHRHVSAVSVTCNVIQGQDEA